MKVTLVPAQTGLAEAAIETLTGRFGFTVMVTVFEVAGLFVGQVAFEVSMQTTWSLFKGEYVYIELFPPTTIPFTFH